MSLQYLKEHKDNTKNKYFRVYYNIINKRLSNTISEGYKENHHILPKSMGGSNKKSNMVFLTAKEHYICHHLLYVFTKGQSKHKMAYAWNMMRTRISIKTSVKGYYNSALYERAKIAFSKSISIHNKGLLLGKKSPFYHHDIYNFYNVNTKEIFVGTEEELSTHDPKVYRTGRITQNPKLSINGWMLQTTSKIPAKSNNIGKNNPAADLSKYTFVHNEEGTIFCTRYSLIDKFSKKYHFTSQGLSDLIKGRQERHRGWSLNIIKDAKMDHSGW